MPWIQRQIVVCGVTGILLYTISDILNIPNKYVNFY